MRRALLLLILLLIGACTSQTTPTPNIPPTRTLAPLPTLLTLAPATTTTEAGTSASTLIAPTLAQETLPPTVAIVASLPPIVTTVPPLVTSAPPTVILPTAVPTYALGDIPSMERRLNDTPLFQNVTSARVQQIFVAGQGMGNRADVFTTIGDSNTTNGDFLHPMGMGADVYCDWGAYTDLDASVTYFSVPPTDDNRTANSFTHHSQAARMGFNSAAVLDPFWASEEFCARGESSLMCEFRRSQPSVAVIMLGGIDISQMDAAQYGDNMRTIVETSIAQGVIPVLTTFVVSPDRGTVLYERSLEFNMMLLDIASAERTPLINLWMAAQSLPDDGIGPDHTHLKAVVGSFCSFDGDQTRYGGTLRNLLTLQVLDTLRRNVLTQ